MSWSPIPDDDWAPLEHERDKFFKVLHRRNQPDETPLFDDRWISCATQSYGPGSRHYPAGGHRSSRTEPLDAARDEMGEAQRLQFRRLQKGGGQFLISVAHTNCRLTKMWPCTVLASIPQSDPCETQVPAILAWASTKSSISFCVVVLARRYQQALFLLYPYCRHPTTQLYKAREIMNLGAAKYGDEREFPFRRLAFADPDGHVAASAFTTCAKMWAPSISFPSRSLLADRGSGK